MRPAGVFPDQGPDVIDDLPDVAHERLGLAWPGEEEEIREDAVEPTRFFLHDAQGVGPLLAGEGFLHTEECRRVDDGRQGIADLVGHACGELARRGQALGLGEPCLQTFPLRHVGDQLEEKDLAVGLAYRGAAQGEAPSVCAGHLNVIRLAHLLTAPERTARAGVGTHADDLVTTTVGDRTELRVHPTVGVPDPEVPVNELEALAEAVHQALVEFLERRGLAAGPVQHHDDDRKGAEEVEDHEGGVHHHVRPGTPAPR